MNLFKILKILTIFILALPLSIQAQSQKIDIPQDGTRLNTTQLLEKGVNLHTDVYCNPRFNFCFRYPSDFFTQVNTGDNDDGILLSNEEGVTVTAYAYYAVDESTETTLRNIAQNLETYLPGTDVLIDLAERNALQANYKYKGNHVFTRTQLNDDVWTTIEIQVNGTPDEKDDMLFNALTELVVYSFQNQDTIN